MAASDTQISAVISGSTKELVERYTEARGVKKGHLIEEALLYHLKALHELPADIIIPARIVVNEETAKALQERVDNPSAPTEAMEELFSEE
jgi:uncharacterized protein (DUF1778 family)